MAAAASAMGASSFEPVGGIDVSIGGAEAAIGELAAASGRVAYIMPDRVHRFERLTMRGLEMQLLLMDILVRTRGLQRGREAPATPRGHHRSLPPPPLIPTQVFTLVDYFQQSTCGAALATLVLAAAVMTARRYMGRRRVAHTTLIDERYL